MRAQELLLKTCHLETPPTLQAMAKKKGSIKDEQCPPANLPQKQLVQALGEGLRMQCPPANLPQKQLHQDGLDLAHLALRLASSQIIPPPSDGVGGSLRPGEKAYYYHYIRAAYDFLEVSKAEIERLQLNSHCQFFESERKGTIRADVEKIFSIHAIIRIDELIELAGVHRIVLSSHELSSIGIRKKWNSLSKTEHRKAIYLCLTSSDYLSPSKYEGTFYDLYNPWQYAEIFGDLDNRKRQANDGFQSVDAMPWEKLIDALKTAKRARELKLKRLSGKKRHQPKPRNDSGQFEAKKTSDRD